MSVQAMVRVMESSEASGINRLVLLVMANRAGGDGDECFASIDRIAFECRINTRTVQRSVARLVELGDLKAHGVHPRHRTNVYAVMPKVRVAESHPPVTSDAPAPPKRKELGGTALLEPQTSLVSDLSSRQRDPIFDALAEIEGLNLAELDRDTGRRIGVVQSKLLREHVGVTPGEIVRRAHNYESHFPDATLTANALVKWWPRLGQPKNGRGPKEGQGARMMREAADLAEQGR